jgi:type VI secretion system protein ImpL
MKALSKQIYHIVLYGVGLGSVAAFVYLVGPMIVIGGHRPLDNPILRDVIIAMLVAAMAGLSGFQFWKRKKAGEALAEGVVGEKEPQTDEPVLKDRMKDALTTLKTASEGKGDFLYDLPWYVIIGPPGSGKTTALVNSGLKFPLSRGATPAAVAGVGGTRYCDWWFTEDAVLIDTAGRYTTQDSDAAVDKKSWLSFLDLLKKNRPRQPINGVIVAISLHDILTAGPAELDLHASAIRARLVELHDHLKVDFPVYVMFTKSDLVAGFAEFFGALGEKSRKQVWGATFQTADKTRNMVGDVPGEFDRLIARLNELVTDRLQEEPAPSTRVSLYGFPAQMAKLRKPVFNFLNQIFEPTRYHANATLRGFYFTSGTQEGTPIDQLIGALSRTFGAQGVEGAGYSGQGRSYFLTDLIGKVIIGEAAWVSTDRAALRRQRIIKAAAYTLLFLVCAGASAAWWTSYTKNRALIDNTIAAANDYVQAAGPIAKETVIADRDLTKVLPLLHKLRFMPVGYGTREEPTPTAETFGLSQRDRLRSVSEEAYHIGLERLLRPRLIYRLEEQFEQRRTDPSFLYEALKVYLMIGGQRPPDRDLIVSWMRRDWADNLYPGAANADGRAALEQHLEAMLKMQSGELLVGVNGALVEDAQTTLARLSISQRAYELMKSQARAGGAADWIPARAGGQDFGLVFDVAQGDTLDSLRVPGFYTYLGFHRDFIGKLPGVAEQLKSEQWVLGQAGQQQAVAEQYERLPADLLALYTKDFVAIWNQVLAKLKMKRLTADKPKYVALASVVAATSPLKKVIESIRDETALTRERADLKKPEEKDKEKKEGAPAPSLLGQAQSATTPGAEIEAAFKAFHVLVEGDATRRPIDALVGNLADIYQSLLMATNPQQQQQANAQLTTQVASLRSNANRFPQPFAQMMQGAANELDGDLTNTRRIELNRILSEQVSGPCQTIINNRFPFWQSDREVPLAEFGKLFGVGGLMDQYFKTSLAPLVDTSKQTWIWRQETPLGRALAQSTTPLQEFQRATEIRETFFATGGQSPSMSLTVLPPSLPMAAAIPAAPPPGGPAFSFGDPSPAAQLPQTASVQYRFEVNGAPVASQQGPAQPAVVQWPGAGGRSAIVVTNEAGRPAVLARDGQWSLFRLIQAGSPVLRGDRLIVSYVVGGRELSYTITAGTSRNPFTLRALREFRCPTGL